MTTRGKPTRWILKEELRSNVIRWRRQTDILEKANANRLLNSIARRRYPVGKSKYPLLDESVREMVKDVLQRSVSR